MDSIKLIVSVRAKCVPIDKFLTPNPSIKSIFGFAEYSPLYGGRAFIEPEILPEDVTYLYKNNIGINLPLTNMYAKREHYERSWQLLEKYNKPNNSVTVYSDDIARWIRKDFPEYSITASCIKEISTLKDIEINLETYDKIVLKSILNENLSLLENIKLKDRIILFANAGAAHGCKSKICHIHRSKRNLEWSPDKNDPKYLKAHPIICARDKIGDPGPGFQSFDLVKFREMGFSTFKTLRQWSSLRAF